MRLKSLLSVASITVIAYALLRRVHELELLLAGTVELKVDAERQLDALRRTVAEMQAHLDETDQATHDLGEELAKAEERAVELEQEVAEWTSRFDQARDVVALQSRGIASGQIRVRKGVGPANERVIFVGAYYAYADAWQRYDLQRRPCGGWTTRAIKEDYPTVIGYISDLEAFFRT